MTDRIAHVITGLDVGGAELIVSRLATRSRQFSHSVLSLTSDGSIGRKLSADGVPVTALGMRKNLTALLGVSRLAHLLRQQKPALVQTWLYHADLAGGLAARRAGIPVVWNLRQTDVARGVHKVSTRIVIRLCALLSRYVPEKIVCGSNAALSVHGRMGFETRNMVVIRNGVDTELFKPDTRLSRDVRNELGIDDTTLIVGRVGRFHPQKGYASFVEMASEVAGAFGDVAFVMAGRGVSGDNRELACWIRKAGLEGKVHLLGERSDAARIIGSLDVLVSSSVFGEGFPNVVAEGMGCGVPCVVTDVGDSAELVADPERIASAGDSRGLARAVLVLLRLDAASRVRVGMRDRERIVEHFGLEAMMGEYEKLYAEMTRRTLQESHPSRPT